ncbi:MAG: ABC transporter substrate-binding protein [Anaerolineae bacterium]|nr:ABC transporter substrate-binding protein [Anaerolineae bacterium]
MHRQWMMPTLVLVLVLSTLVGLVACGGQPTAAPEEAPEESIEAELEPIKVGWFGALTGDWALWGEASRNGTQFTIDMVNEAGGVLGGRQLELIAYDNKSDQLESVNVVRRLITEDGVVAVIGTNSSGSNIAVAPIAEENKVPVIATYATNPRVTQPEEGVLMEYTYRVCFTDPYQGSVMADFAFSDLGARKAAILYEISSDYSVGLRDFFVQRWEALGGELVADEAFKTGDVEFRAQLTSIKDADPDVIIMPFLAKEVALAAKQARDLGITVPFIGGDGWPSPTLLEMAASAVEGCYFVDHTNVNAENVQDYRAAYEAEYGKDIQVNAIMTHDAVMVLVAAIEKAGSADPVAIRDALEQIDPVEGFTGNITIDPETHNPLGKSAVIMTIKDGAFEYYKVFEPMGEVEAPEEPEEPAAELEPIKVGWFGALTGDWALWGEASRNGTLFTMEMINEAGGLLGGRQFELIAYDNKSDQLESVNVVRRLITEDEVVAVIGTNSSGSNIAVAPIAEENKVPVIATYATNPRVTQPEEGVLMEYTFRVCFTDPYQGSVIADFAYGDLEARKAAILYEISSDYSVGLRDYFVQQWEALGGELVADEAFKTGDVEFRAQLTSIKDAEPDVIVMPFLAKEVALAAKQARDLGITVPFIGGDGWPSPTLLEMAASAVEGCYFVDHTNVNAENVQDYRADYEERFGSDIQVNAIMTHDAVLVLAAAIEKAGSTDPAAIRDALEQIDPVEGFTGNITIDPETHNPVGKSAVIMTIKDGEFEFYTVVEPMK